MFENKFVFSILSLPCDETVKEADVPTKYDYMSLRAYCSDQYLKSLSKYSFHAEQISGTSAYNVDKTARSFVFTFSTNRLILTSHLAIGFASV